MVLQTQMNTVRTDLLEIVGRHGLPAVYTELQGQMRETYEFLRHIYEPPKNNIVIPITETIPDRMVTPLHKPISVVVSQEPPKFDLSPIPQEEEKEEKTHDPTLKEIVIQEKKNFQQMHIDEWTAKRILADGTNKQTEKFSKAKHREEVLKKNKELTEKGIKPESLLTKDNLTEWLGKGMSYMRIAREVVGVHENEIAAIAKTFGLQSDVKKYIVMKKGGK